MTKKKDTKKDEPATEEASPPEPVEEAPVPVEESAIEPEPEKAPAEEEAAEKDADTYPCNLCGKKMVKSGGQWRCFKHDGGCGNCKNIGHN